MNGINSGIDGISVFRKDDGSAVYFKLTDLFQRENAHLRLYIASRIFDFPYDEWKSYWPQVARYWASSEDKAEAVRENHELYSSALEPAGFRSWIEMDRFLFGECCIAFGVAGASYPNWMALFDKILC